MREVWTYLFIFRRRMLATKNHLHPRTAQHALSGDDFTLILLGDFAGYRQPYTLPPGRKVSTR